MQADIAEARQEAEQGPRDPALRHAAGFMARTEKDREIMPRIKRTGATETQAQGFSYRSGRRIVVDIDVGTFAEIQRYAAKEKITVSASVRELVEFGLESAKK